MSINVTRNKGESVYANHDIAEIRELRKQIYESSDIITNRDNDRLIEVFGKLNLEDKFNLWDQYGAPREQIYFSMEHGKIVGRAGLPEFDLHWTVGWISTDGVVFICVDILDVLLYHYLSNYNRYLSKDDAIRELTIKKKEA